MHVSRAFNLYCNQSFGAIQDKIDFQAILSSPEIKLIAAFQIIVDCSKFLKDQCLQRRSGQLGIRVQRAGWSYCPEYSGIEIIKFLMVDQLSFRFPDKNRQAYPNQQIFEYGKIEDKSILKHQKSSQNLFFKRKKSILIFRRFDREPY